jgi:hypothetical protein
VSGLSGTSAPIVAPAGSVMVVRDIDAYCGLTGIETVCEMHFVDGLSNASMALFTFDITSKDKGDFQWRGRQVFDGNSGEGFYFDVSAAQFDVVVSGYILTD